MGTLSYAKQLELAGRLTEPAIKAALWEFNPPRGSSGLDAGCGIGRHSLLLTEAVGDGGKVVALDILAENLSIARAKARRTRAGKRAIFLRGDIQLLPFSDGSFDWVWCADTLWGKIGDVHPAAVVKELARAVKPGGRVALLFWSSQTLLPGYPELEARLNKAFAETTRYLAGIAPDRHFMRAPDWLSRAGLRDVRARSFIAEARVPLSAELRRSLAFCFSMFWGELEPHVSETDWRDYRRICVPESADFIPDRPGYYGFVVYTLFSGTAG